MKKNNKKLFLRVFLFILIVLWAILVFNFSNQKGEESSALSRKLIEFFIKDENIIDLVEPYVRKAAHFSEYALGGMLFILLFSTYEWTDKKKLLISIPLGIWYATTDEIHQLMVSERNGSLFDIYIDSLGFATGALFMLLIIKIIQIIIVNKKNNLRNSNK